jgi:aminoglycoside phosphotransferase (APT) family kinase protein
MDTPVIDAALVRALVAEQFPQWSALPVEFVPQGNDHRTFRLGDALSVRIPSAEGYVPQGEKEHRWLPVLAPQLPLPIPAPIALGAPSGLFPYPWSVYGWLEGVVLPTDAVVTDTRLAEDLAAFLVALQAADPEGPPPGLHSAFRGCPPSVWDEDVRRCIRLLASDAGRATEVWAEAAAETATTPVWFHGDVAPGNLLLRGGRLSAVLDFGCSGVGDPACDVAAAWMMFDGGARAAFLEALAPDEGMLRRGRGWALWKALLWVEAGGAEAERGRRVMAAVLG